MIQNADSALYLFLYFSVKNICSGISYGAYVLLKVRVSLGCDSGGALGMW